MIKVYNGNEFENAKLQRKKSLNYYFVALGVFLAGFITIFVLFKLQPAESKSIITWLKIGEMILCALFFIFSYFYLGIRQSRIKAYYTMLYYMRNGIKEKNEGTFVRFSQETKIKDKVEFNSMVLLEWSDKEQDFLERGVLLDKEKEFPPFKRGDRIFYITMGNVLCEWEINNQN